MCVCVFVCALFLSFLLGQLGTFDLIKLPALWWGTLFVKMKSYLLDRVFIQTLSIYIARTHSHSRSLFHSLSLSLSLFLSFSLSFNPPLSLSLFCHSIILKKIRVEVF